MTDLGKMAAIVIGALAASFLLSHSKAHADTWLSATVASYHGNRDRGYNERNYGLGFEHDRSATTRWAAGFYENSHYRTTVYGGLLWLPVQAGPFRFGVLGSVATGYTHAVTVVPLPTIAVESRHFGANIGIVPSLHRSIGVIGLQLKAKLP